MRVPGSWTGFLGNGRGKESAGHRSFALDFIEVICCGRSRTAGPRRKGQRPRSLVLYKSNNVLQLLVNGVGYCRRRCEIDQYVEMALDHLSKEGVPGATDRQTTAVDHPNFGISFDGVIAH